MTTLYDDLGVSPDASAEDIRRAYRGLARRLHPDLNREPGTDERMGRINDAWAVLGDPEERRRYDQTIRRPAAPAPAETPRWHQVAAEPAGPSLRWLRPSFVAIAVLAIIFIVTAYAGPHSRNRAPVPVPSTANGGQPSSGLVNSAYVGQCLLVQTGYDAIVPCAQPNTGLVVGQTTHSADCPAGTTVHQLIGRPQFVCLVGAGR